MAIKRIDDKDACDVACNAAVDRWSAAQDVADARRKARKAAAQERFQQAAVEPLRLHDLRMAKASDKYNEGRAPFKAQIAEDWRAFFERSDSRKAAGDGDFDKKDILAAELAAEESVLSARHGSLTKNADEEFVTERDAAVREIQAVCERLNAVRKAELEAADADYEQAMRPVGDRLNAESLEARQLHTPNAFAKAQAASKARRQ